MPLQQKHLLELSGGVAETQELVTCPLPLQLLHLRCAARGVTTHAMGLGGGIPVVCRGTLPEFGCVGVAPFVGG